MQNMNFFQIFQICSLLFSINVALGADSPVKRGVFGFGYGDGGFGQWSGFSPNHLAGLVSSPQIVYAKPVLVSP